MSSLVEIRPILTEDVPKLWDEASSLLQKAVDESDGELSIDDIYISILEKRRALWLVFESGEMIAAVTVRIEDWPSGLRIATIDYAGGKDFKLWDNFTDYISPFYKSIGCGKLEIAGRLGWLRLHTDKGFKIRYYVMRKDL